MQTYFDICVRDILFIVYMLPSINISTNCESGQSFILTKKKWSWAECDLLSLKVSQKKQCNWNNTGLIIISTLIIDINNLYLQFLTIFSCVCNREIKQHSMFNCHVYKVGFCLVVICAELCPPNVFYVLAVSIFCTNSMKISTDSSQCPRHKNALSIQHSSFFFFCCA